MGSNIDEDFASRYQTMIQFAIPGPEERYRLWTNAFSGSVRLHASIDIHEIAENYELSRAAINKIFCHCGRQL